MNYINFSIVFVFILVARIHSQSGDNYLIPVNGSFADVIAQTNDDEGNIVMVKKIMEKLCKFDRRCLNQYCGDFICLFLFVLISRSLFTNT